MLHFAGRRDTQVKVNGFRVELGGIEVVLGQHALVLETAVVAPELEGVRRIVAFVAPVPADEDAATSALLDHAERLLAPYMIPAEVFFLPELPKNDNGKIDRKRLHVLAELRPGAPGA